MTALFQRIPASLITAVLLCHPYFKTYLPAGNRVFFHWEHRDSLILAGMIGSIAEPVYLANWKAGK